MLKLIKSFLILTTVIAVNNSVISNDRDFIISDTNTANHKTSIIIDDIAIKGNVKTKINIILRELLFKKNDTLNYPDFIEALKQSKENIVNTSLFHSVNIDTVNNKNHYLINIVVIERFYIMPYIVFQNADRNFSNWWKAKNLAHLDYGFSLTHENFRGRKETVRLTLIMGFNNQLGLAYLKPNINKKQTFGAGFEFGLINNHEVAYTTIENKLQYYKNFAHYVQQNKYGVFHFTYRGNIHNTNIFQIRYNEYIFDNTILKLNNKFTNNLVNNQFLSLYYMFKNDYRNFKAYPLKGHYFDLDITKDGLGVLAKEKIDMLYLRSNLRFFWHLKNKFYFATGTAIKISNNSFQPYFMQRGLGYNNEYVRAYEYYVVDGQNYAIVKNTLKYELIKDRIIKVDYIKSNKFNTIPYSLYFNLFGDVGYADDKYYNINSKLSNQLLYGYGVGIDYVTYYDKVVRLEFSINGIGEVGMFINFVAPI